MSPAPAGVVWSTHTTYTILPDTSTNGSRESPALLLRFFMPPKVIALITCNDEDGELGCTPVVIVGVLVTEPAGFV
jgi:hypothetical protein